MEAIQINPFEYADVITQETPKGILLTTRAEDKVNTMVIGWGQLGTLWGRPVFTVFVRTSRETCRLLDINPEFTVNVPLEGSLDKEIFLMAGHHSGRDHDKIDELGLTLVPGHKVSVPGIAQVPLTLECKVVYRHEMDKALFPAADLERFYPEDVTDIDKAGNCYTHILFIAEIVDAYILE